MCRCLRGKSSRGRSTPPEPKQATLNAGGLEGAASDMTELKLGHGESKHEVPAWLTRLLYQGRLSFNRGKGPAAKAPELQFEDLDEDAKLRRGRGRAWSRTPSGPW